MRPARRGARLALLSFVLAALLAEGRATAQSTPGEWEFTVAPYMMGAAMEGTVGAGPLEAEIDLPFSDIWSNLDFGAMVYVSAKNDRWSVSGGLVYMDLGHQEESGQHEAELSVGQTVFELGGGYRVTETVTLLAGARLVDLTNEIRLAGEFFDTSAEVGATWVDPFVGAQLVLPLSERWWVDLRGDIGGFGLGADFAWQAWGDVGFRASDRWSFFLGYHALDMDYEDGSGADRFRYDVLASGPQVGLAVHF